MTQPESLSEYVLDDEIEEQYEPAPTIPDQMREDAEELIRSLAAVAGDTQLVYDRIGAYCQRRDDLELGLGALAAVVVLIFTECITTPTGSGEYAEVTYPTTDTQE